MQVVSADHLLQDRRIDSFEHQVFFYNRTVLTFNSLGAAARFAQGFLTEYLVPKYGWQEAIRFPMAKSQRHIDGTVALAEAMGAKIPNPNQETWLAVPNNRFPEVQEYIDRRKQQVTFKFYDPFE